MEYRKGSPLPDKPVKKVTTPRQDRQQPIIIQNFELLTPGQLKFKKPSKLSTANLYLSNASLSRNSDIGKEARPLSEHSDRVNPLEYECFVTNPTPGGAGVPVYDSDTILSPGTGSQIKPSLISSSVEKSGNRKQVTFVDPLPSQFSFTGKNKYWSADSSATGNTNNKAYLRQAYNNQRDVSVGDTFRSNTFTKGYTQPGQKSYFATDWAASETSSDKTGQELYTDGKPRSQDKIILTRYGSPSSKTIGKADDVSQTRNTSNTEATSTSKMPQSSEVPSISPRIQPSSDGTNSFRQMDNVHELDQIDNKNSYENELNIQRKDSETHVTRQRLPDTTHADNENDDETNSTAAIDGDSDGNSSVFERFSQENSQTARDFSSQRLSSATSSTVSSKGSFHLSHQVLPGNFTLSPAAQRVATTAYNKSRLKKGHNKLGMSPNNIRSSVDSSSETSSIGENFGPKIVRLTFLKDEFDIYKRGSNDQTLKSSSKGKNSNCELNIDTSERHNKTPEPDNSGNNDAVRSNSHNRQHDQSKAKPKRFPSSGPLGQKSQGELNTDFLMQIYSASGEKKPTNEITAVHAANDISNSDPPEITASKRPVTPPAKEKVKWAESVDAFAFSPRARDKERLLLSARPFGRPRSDDRQGIRSRSSSAGPLVGSRDSSGAERGRESSSREKVADAERFLFKVDRRVRERTFLNRRLEQLVMSTTQCSMSRRVMERSRSNLM